MVPQLRRLSSRSFGPYLASVALGIALTGPASASGAQSGPQIQHAELKCVLSGQHLILRAAVAPMESLTTVKAYFRANLYTQFYYVEMTRAGDFYEGILPKPSPETDGIHYYLEAMDSAFNSARTAEFTPQVTSSEGQCDEENPVAPLYTDPATITVGSTGAGAPLPPGFLPEGIASTIPTIARQAGGTSTGLLIGLGAAGAGAATVGVLVANSGDEGGELPPGADRPPTTSPPPTPPTPMPPMTPSPPTSPPSTGATACFETSPTPATIPVGESVRFDASCSTPDRSLIASYAWDLSDGRTDRNSRVVNRRYGSPGTFPATVTVTAMDGSTDTTSMNIIVQDTAPPPSGGGGGSPGPPSTADVQVTASSIAPAVTHRFTVRNNGPLTANAVTFSHSITGGNFVAGSYAGSFTGFSGCTFSAPSASATCTAPSMAPGAVFTVTITVTPISPTNISSTGSVTSGSPADTVSNNSASASTAAQRTSDETAERVILRPKSHLELAPADGSVLAQLTFNESVNATTDNSGPSTHNVPARTGDNLVEGRVLSIPTSEGAWRFDFAGADGFVPGSFRVEGGNVVARSSHQIVFRVAPGSRRVRFRFEVRRP